MKQRSALATSAAALTLLASATSLATTTTPPPTDPSCVIITRGGLGDVPDAEINSLTPNYHLPAAPEVNTGYSTATGEKRAIFGFDLSSIPARSTVSSAKFNVLLNSNTAQTVSVNRVIAPWSEATVTWGNFGGIDPTELANFRSGGFGVWKAVPVTGLVQSWLNGDFPNYGILLKEGLLGKTGFKSSDNVTASNRPWLEVCYTIPAVIPKGSIGDTVWYDSNGDGLKDASEPGIHDAVVDLRDCSGTRLATTVTDWNGAYSFPNLVEGCYVVDVDDATLPAGHILSTDAEPFDVLLGPGENVTDADFGYFTPSSIGDTVWLDSDADGVYEPATGELGVNGVLVELFDGDTLIDSTVTGYSPYTTGEPGFYLFDGLRPSLHYRVVVTSDNFALSGPLAGEEPTADYDGGFDSAAFVALSGGEDLRDVDFGYRHTCGNGVCGADESCSSCALDCGVCPSVCGNGTCEAGEDCSTCSSDCGVCPPVCGDTVCEGSESCSTCASDCGACPPACGNGTCEAGESCSACAQDCGACPPVCGDGTCDITETCSDCASDCGACPPVCGDGTCAAGESCSDCASDCGACPAVCGNGTCEAGESCSDCASDCGACPAVCGNGTCEAGEGCANCAQDCGACPPVCGNNNCEAGETCGDCASDCGACPPVCGDGTCDITESCSSCTSDCGACPPVCGDGACNGSESCSTCASDCGACAPACGDGACNGSESCSTCASDCGACPAACGDGTCNSDEDCSTCSRDCGICPAVCGNHACEAGEGCSNCPGDCGACPAVCGNHTCEAGESCSDCPGDCGACPAVCGNHACEAGESCSVCPGDCGACPAVCGNGTCEAGEGCAACPSDCGLCPAVCGNGICQVGETCSNCSRDCGAPPPVCGDNVCNRGEDCSSCSRDCGACPRATPGTGTIGYWLNHPSAWPVQTMSIGGKTYTKAQLLAIISQPTKGDVTYIIAQQLIAAKLNVGVGTRSSCIESTIAAADAWLSRNKLGSNVKGGSVAWLTGAPLSATLDSYNNGLLCARHRDEGGSCGGSGDGDGDGEHGGRGDDDDDDHGGGHGHD